MFWVNFPCEGGIRAIFFSPEPYGTLKPSHSVSPFGSNPEPKGGRFEGSAAEKVLHMRYEVPEWLSRM